MSEHARLSASAAHRWLYCQGSIAAIESLPVVDRNKSSKYSREGTAAHAMAALALEKKESCAVVVATNDNPEWNLELARDIQPYVDAVNIMAEGNLLLIEQRVDYSHSIGIPDSFGTADAIIIADDGAELIVCDLKAGRGIEVSAEENEQLLLYALGVLESFNTIIDATKLKRVRLVISQPRLNSLREWDCSMEYLEAFRQDAAKAAAKAIAMAEGKEPIVHTPGEETCRWCSFSAKCPALAAKVEETIDAEFENLDEAPPVPADNALLALKMNAIPLIESWCTAVRAAVEAQLIQGQAVPGYKLVQGKQGNRKWIDGKDAERLLKSFRLKTEEIYDMSVISPTAAEKLLKDNPTRWKRAELLITRTAGKPSVALESDRRPAIEVTPVEDDFEDLTGKEDLWKKSTSLN